MESHAPAKIDLTETIPLVGPFEELIELGFTRRMLHGLTPAVSATHLARYAPGDIIYHQGTEPEFLYVIRNGRIKLLNYLESGRARIVRLHKRGSIIGLNGLLNEPNAHTAMAITEVMIYQIPMHLIKAVKHDDLDTYSQLLEHWYEYLNTADRWITDFSTGAIRGRVARLVRFLLETDESATASQVTLLRVEEMADILGVTPESVSRTMADFKRNDILQAVENGRLDCYRCDLRRLFSEAER